MAELPVARVVRGVLARAPRRVPLTLSLRLLFGGIPNSVIYLSLAFVLWILAVGKPDVPPPPTSDAVPMEHIGLGMIALAAVFLIAVMIHALWRLRLLRRGIPVDGTLVEKREVEGSESSVWYYKFRYAIGGRTYTVEHKMQTPEPRLEDDPHEQLIYLPSKPQRAYPVDHLPGYPTVDANGQLVARDKHVWLAFIMPALAVSGVLALLYL